MRFASAYKYLEGLEAFKSHDWISHISWYKTNIKICKKCGYRVKDKATPFPFMNEHKDITTEVYINNSLKEGYIILPQCSDVQVINMLYDVDIQWTGM